MWETFDQPQTDGAQLGKGPAGKGRSEEQSVSQEQPTYSNIGPWKAKR